MKHHIKMHISIQSLRLNLREGAENLKFQTWKITKKMQIYCLLQIRTMCVHLLDFILHVRGNDLPHFCYNSVMYKKYSKNITGTFNVTTYSFGIFDNLC